MFRDGQIGYSSSCTVAAWTRFSGRLSGSDTEISLQPYEERSRKAGNSFVSAHGMVNIVLAACDAQECNRLKRDSAASSESHRRRASHLVVKG